MLRSTLFHVDKADECVYWLENAFHFVHVCFVHTRIHMDELVCKGSDVVDFLVDTKWRAFNRLYATKTQCDLYALLLLVFFSCVRIAYSLCAVQFDSLSAGWLSLFSS